MLAENKKLDAKIQEARELKRQTESIMKQIRKSAIREIRQYMQRYEITLEDLSAAQTPRERAASAASETKKAKKSSIKAKYRSDDGKLTWTGRGLKPKWLTEELKKGRKIDEFLIDKN
ncbi:H-NS histone family protein [Mesosutterella sp. OilRF-GAM-744-9]|uniref:H-NS histone family protein n=1 Tax=Mesosutterella porci TaxID=2915351 RepID=A0ABS9MQT9_9BURK|nr:H-NS histone family protein [Mesosutterella sp. oilRF-744-WT-GAM-9]MCG5030988.1 H-NS histone family protein [Mesosutterella sp. oilRF-744-WT-GAM-9]